MSNNYNLALFKTLPVIGILRGFQEDETLALVQAAGRGGLTNLEITMNTPHASRLIALARKTAGQAMNIGAGTVLNETHLDAALEAGASFIVTPIVVPAIIERCRRDNIPIFPGAFTPTEIARAWDLGATMVKVFPADMFGPAYLRAVKAPLSDARLMPTGGVRLDNVEEWRAAGADAYGVGSPLFAKDKVLSQDWDWVESQCRQFRARLGALAQEDPPR